MHDSEWPLPKQEFSTAKIIIGLGGSLRSGKDTAADFLVDDLKFEKLGMSDDSLHQFVMRQNPWIRLAGRGFARYRDIINAYGYVEAKKISDLREFLQLTGTEAGRDLIGENVWTNIIRDKILASSAPGVVVTGIRYPNELDMIHELGGTTIYVSRAESPSKPSKVPSEATTLEGALEAVSQAHTASQHSSETSLSGKDFDHILANNSTLEDLRTNIHRLVAPEITRDHGRKKNSRTRVIQNHWLELRPED
jgi:dephospho-CoA kinase